MIEYFSLIVEVRTPKITLLTAFNIINIVIKLQSLKNYQLSFRIVSNNTISLLTTDTQPQPPSGPQNIR